MQLLEYIEVFLFSPLKVWDLKEGHLFYTMCGHQGGVFCTHFSPDGEYFSTAGHDTNVLVWKTNIDQTSAEVSVSKQVPKKTPKAYSLRLLYVDHSVVRVQMSQRKTVHHQVSNSLKIKEVINLLKHE